MCKLAGGVATTMFLQLRVRFNPSVVSRCNANNRVNRYLTIYYDYVLKNGKKKKKKKKKKKNPVRRYNRSRETSTLVRLLTTSHAKI
jgi:hypothetical protein